MMDCPAVPKAFGTKYPLSPIKGWEIAGSFFMIFEIYFPSTSLIFFKSFVGEAGFSIYTNPFSIMSYL